MNKFFTLFALGITLYASAQKKVLTHEDYDKWKSIGSYDLSANGKYVRYEINPQEGDGNLYVYDANNDETKKFTRGYGAKFTHNNNYLVFKVKPEYAETREAKRKEKKKDEMPRNHVVVVDLNTWVMDTINEASSFKISEEYEGWVAIKLENKRKEKKDKSKDEKNSKEEESAEEKKSEKEKSSKEKDEKKSKKKIVKNRILLWELGGSKRDTIGWVNEYSFAKKSPRLLYSIKNEKADSIKGVFFYENGQSELLDTNGKSFVKLAISEQGDKMVWSSTQDSADAEV
ncbi:MAG: hypothetical protein N4A46_04270 [Schleiferiaceae bacterium]|jgi:hypothetical protein|nr:hypothetical protein [Schleiferiaceae bacterium]